MEITVTTRQGAVPVTIVQPHGEVDASNYTELVNRVEGLRKDGASDFLIDFRDVSYMSSAGLVALHAIAVMLRGEQPAGPQSPDRSLDPGLQKHIKVLNPQSNVADTLKTAGFTEFLQVFDDEQQAVASF